MGSTDDSTDGFGPVWCYSHLAPIDGFAVCLRFRGEFEHFTDDDRPCDFSPVDGFFFESDGDKRFVEVVGCCVLGDIHPFTQLADRYAH